MSTVLSTPEACAYDPRMDQSGGATHRWPLTVRIAVALFITLSAPTSAQVPLRQQSTIRAAGPGSVKVALRRPATIQTLGPLQSDVSVTGAAAVAGFVLTRSGQRRRHGDPPVALIALRGSNGEQTCGGQCAPNQGLFVAGTYAADDQGRIHLPAGAYYWSVVTEPGVLFEATLRLRGQAPGHVSLGTDRRYGAVARRLPELRSASGRSTFGSTARLRSRGVLYEQIRIGGEGPTMHHYQLCAYRDPGLSPAYEPGCPGAATPTQEGDVFDPLGPPVTRAQVWFQRQAGRWALGGSVSGLSPPSFDAVAGWVPLLPSSHI